MCEAHRKRLHPSRAGGKTLLEPVEKRVPAGEALRELALAYAEADSDLEFARAEEDLTEVSRLLAESKKALERLKRGAERYGSELLSKAHGEHVKRGLAAARAAGVRLGRPPVLDYEGVKHVVQVTGSPKAAADHLGVCVETVYRALRRGLTTETPANSSSVIADGPPKGGGSSES